MAAVKVRAVGGRTAEVKYQKPPDQIVVTKVGLAQGSDLQLFSTPRIATSIFFICADITVRCPTCRKNKCKPSYFPLPFVLSF